MSTIEEFEHAPIGATATTPDGKRAVKTFNTTSPWRTELDDWHGYTMSNTNMPAAGYTLDPALTAPASAREALDLAWKLAHPVKEGQIIPAETGLLLREEFGLLREDEALDDWEPITEPTDDIRTLDELPNS